MRVGGSLAGIAACKDRNGVVGEQQFSPAVQGIVQFLLQDIGRLA